MKVQTKISNNTRINFSKTKDLKEILLKNVKVFYNYKNLKEDTKITKTADTSVTTKSSSGYWTLEEVQKVFKKFGADFYVEKHTGKSILKTTDAIQIGGNLKRLLNFTDSSFTQNSTTTGGVCNILNGLEYIKIICDKINGEFNLYNDEGLLKESNILCMLEIGSVDLLGGTQSFLGVDARARLKGKTNFLNLSLLGNNNEPVGEALLEFYLTEY